MLKEIHREGYCSRKRRDRRAGELCKNAGMLLIEEHLNREKTLVYK
jgi:hypothetical protein